jgi:ABC-type transport system involved in multi-copper enzyme maturation permease subunit
MFDLLKIEWLKIKKYPAFWWVIGITALSYPGVNYIFHSIYNNLVAKNTQGAQIAKMLIGNPFSFPEAWHTVAYFSCLFVFIPAVVVIMFMSNEYSYKTYRQNIIDGWSRNQFMTSKLIDVLLVSLLVTVLYSIVSLIIGYTNSTKADTDRWRLTYYTGLFALQTFSQLSLAFLVGYLVRKAFIALGIFIFYFIVLEPVLVGVLKFKANDIGRFLPLEISDRLIPVPAFLGKIDRAGYEKALSQINPHIIYTVILTAIIWIICFRVNKRKDL